MKTLITVLLSLFALTVHAEGNVERFIVDDEWPAFTDENGMPAPNIIAPGEFFCTGGGEAVAPFLCEGGNGIVIRGTEMMSCVGNARPYSDGRLEGTAWFDLTAIWSSSYTGPVAGRWRIVPGECDVAALQDPDNYWEGTYTGRRFYVMGPQMPVWITRLKFVGYGVGDELAGQTMEAREVIKTFYIVPTPWELLPPEVQQIIGTGPEGRVRVKITH